MIYTEPHVPHVALFLPRAPLPTVLMCSARRRCNLQIATECVLIRHAAAFEPDLPYPVARHIMSEISRCFEAADPGGYDDLLNHVELARRTGDGMTLNNAAGQIAHESEANVRLQNALHKRLRQSFGEHADLYRLIAVDPNTRAAIDRLIVEHERRSIRALAVAAVSLDFVASQA